MRSLSEIDTISKRALRAKGFSWGTSEEMGKSIKQLELFGLPGLKNLNHICQNVPVTTAQDMAEHVLKFCDGRLSNRMIDTPFMVQCNKSKSYDYEKSVVQLDQFMV